MLLIILGRCNMLIIRSVLHKKLRHISVCKWRISSMVFRVTMYINGANNIAWELVFGNNIEVTSKALIAPLCRLLVSSQITVAAPNCISIKWYSEIFYLNLQSMRALRVLILRKCNIKINHIIILS